MAIAKKITFEGNTYNLGNKDRVSAAIITQEANRYDSGNTFTTVPEWVTNGDADLSVTEALHAGKVIYQTDVSADRDYNIATPSKAGITYRFIGVGTGAAADGHDIILDFSDDACYFKGAVMFHDTSNDDSGAALNAGAWANGSTHDRFQINVPAAYDITLVSLSTTVMYITGHVLGATAPAAAAQD